MIYHSPTKTNLQPKLFEGKANQSGGTPTTKKMKQKDYYKLLILTLSGLFTCFLRANKHLNLTSTGTTSMDDSNKLLGQAFKQDKMLAPHDAINRDVHRGTINKTY